MMTLKEKVGSPSMVDGQVGQTVLDFITEKQVVTLEMIVSRFPWIRWGDLFSCFDEKGWSPSTKSMPFLKFG